MDINKILQVQESQMQIYQLEGGESDDMGDPQAEQIDPQNVRGPGAVSSLVDHDKLGADSDEDQDLDGGQNSSPEIDVEAEASNQSVAAAGSQNMGGRGGKDANGNVIDPMQVPE